MSKSGIRNKFIFSLTNEKMNSDLKKISFSWKDLPKLFIVLGAISIICFLFPSHSNQNYKYFVGESWAYNDLVSEKAFSFSANIAESGNDTISGPIYSFRKGDVLISRGQLVNNAEKQILDHYFLNVIGPRTVLNSVKLIYFLGYFLLTALIIGALILYSFKYFPSICKTSSGVLFLVIWPVIFSIVVYLVGKNEVLSLYMIPFCITPIVVYNFYGGRLALFVHIVVVLISSFLSSLGYEFTFLQILAGIVTVLIISETRYWNKFFMAIFVILLTYLIGYLGLALINSGSLISSEIKTFVWLGVNALLLLLAYPFIPIIEKIFGFTSSITIAELADMNKPLLRELSIKAPGTFQHSLQVANLSETAAEAIGANGLLVKTAALYHDIGKMNNPFCFIENNNGTNPHDELNNFESAKIIIGHVTEGEAMAKKARLPKLINDFITTHHGTTRVEYFYRTQLNDEPDREFDETLFRYPGPKPSSKEQSIMMLADSIEAAAKSLKNPTGGDIDELIDKIVDYKIDEGQLSESALSFRELKTCVETFRTILRSIYHVRIEYPESNSEE